MKHDTTEIELNYSVICFIKSPFCLMEMHYKCNYVCVAGCTHSHSGTYLPSITGGENPHGSATLFHIPEEPER